MTSVRTSKGQTFVLGQTLGKGGEGTVYTVVGVDDLAIKLYNTETSNELCNKIATMVYSQYHKLSNLVAFPIDLVIDSHGKTIGFTMRKVVGVKPIHELYSPLSRKSKFPHADYRFLVRTALNVSKAVATVHQSGCVIGDINHSGFLVSDEATVTLIDSDSFQIQSGSRIYRCKVGVSEYTPPELQGQVLANVDRTHDHDAFGLAVLLFHQLFMGRHPFVGRFSGYGEMPIKKAIVEGRFAYSRRKSETRMEPPPFAPTLIDFPDDIGTAFERAFRPIRSLTEHRPTAADWVRILGNLEIVLMACKVNPTHHYWRNAPSCPWCRLERGTGSTIFKIPQTKAKNSITIEADLSALEHIQGPGPAPDLESLLGPVAGLTVSFVARRAHGNKQKRRIASIIMVIVGITLQPFVSGSGIICLLIAIGLVLIKSKSESDIYSELKKATDEWEHIQTEWLAETGPGRFDQKKTALQKLNDEYHQLPLIEKNKLDDLERQKRAIQLRKYLESNLIVYAKIPYIGEGRKTALASYGIESAWDIAENRILTVPGFGTSLTSELVKWRMMVEGKFVFNPSLATDQPDVQRVKSEFAKRRSEIGNVLISGAAELRRLNDIALASRTKPSQRAIDSYKRFKEAKLNAAAV